MDAVVALAVESPHQLAQLAVAALDLLCRGRSAVAVVVALLEVEVLACVLGHG